MIVRRNLVGLAAIARKSARMRMPLLAAVVVSKLFTKWPAETLDRLRQLTQCNVQSNWHYWDGDLPIEQAVDPKNWMTWPIATPNAKNHLSWPKGKQARWFTQIIQVPSALNHYPLQGMTLRLAVQWWANLAQIYVQGQLVQEGDIFDSSTRLLLGRDVSPGETWAIALRLLSPGHDEGALMYSRCHYEAAMAQPAEPGFVADELTVLHTYLQAHAPEQLPQVEKALRQIQWGRVSDRIVFDQSLSALRDHLKPLAAPLRQQQIGLLGHAHLDMAWLWTVAETWEAAERTFCSVLSLQKDFPALTFCHSTPALYAWMEQHRPDLMTQIQAQVKAEKWEIVGGFWIEPDLNLIGGEAIARQLLYGQHYCQQTFGKICPIAWVPDTFGFTWQLPQFLKQAGVEYFVTQKLRWNDTTQFPYDLFRWQAPDGSQVTALMSAPIGEGIDPLKMVTYLCEWEAKTQQPEALWLPGVGDHGGGPTRDMLEVAQRWEQSPFFPTLRYTSALEYLRSRPVQPLPIWNSELYLEFHRGCYTTHADQKQFNRQCEVALYQAELWASLATLTSSAPYPKAALETAWKQVLFNQFHDILPGSSITAVYEEANREWQTAHTTAQTIAQNALAILAAQIALPDPPTANAQAIVVFNSLNWSRSHLVELTAPTSDTWEVRDSAGSLVPSQISQAHRLLFLAEAVPSIGYRVFWLVPATSHATSLDANSAWILDNGLLRVEIDPATGDIARLFDWQHQREVLVGAGNQLQAFCDQGQYWDAWNIDPDYAQHPLPKATLVAITWGDRGSLRQTIRVTRQLGQSTFWQDYSLEVGVPLLTIHTTVDWQERHVLVKTAFPFTVEAAVATYEIACGAIQRPTIPKTEADRAQWEVSALGWADLTDTSTAYGVSLLTTCKHGYDSQPNQLRLTLLRGAEWPDPEADRGHHSFIYAIYPHAGSWQTANTPHQAAQLNQPLQALWHKPLPAFNPTLPASSSLLSLNATNLMLMCFKQAEAKERSWTLRCYDAYGKTSSITVSSDLALQLENQVTLLEEPIPTDTTIHPWQIASFSLASTE